MTHTDSVGAEGTISPNAPLEQEKAPTGPFNPGDTARVVKVWAVPADARPQAVLFPDTTAFDVSAHRIAVG